MSEPKLSELLAVAMEAAYLGGRRTLAYFNTGVAVETKGDNTPVTCADRESEQIIRGCITRAFPGHSILGEEQGQTEGNPDYRWIIDPIDGTKSFIHGVPLYGVLIGVEVKGKASVGVVYMPALDEMVSAATGLGCRWNGRPARVSSAASLGEAIVMASSITTATSRSDAFENLAAKTKFQRTWGDAYGYVLVATGRAEIMVDSVIKPWDIAPMLPIVQEAGGRFTAWDGKATIWGNDAVATNGTLHQEVLGILQAEKMK
ncbi:MAG TPA: inositol monophosphatase family protein [Tepidisphaeraceae bacterium]|jgi:histidinol phosphatase-like enzyme (inositol monophosphatase family)|nr:inositol monophosphatase family protein [Tepidisphaeraceae bacterium]